ncbi:MAG: leucine-rich repeat domain-containing protein [Clostridia bacterium]|nr:leucine-rich repeat domain-containing protein [Clostridia bacterium]
MKRHFGKSFVGVLLTTCLLLALPFSALADEESEAEAIEGYQEIGGVTFTYAAAEGVAAITGAAGDIGDTLTVPSSIAGYKVVGIGETAFAQGQFTSVTLPSTLTTLGDKAFYMCRNLESITLPKSVTQIGDYAFYYCDKLKSLDIPDGVTEISEYMLYACLGLETLKLPKDLYEICDYGLYACESLKTLDIPDSVVGIANYAMYDCIGLTELELPSSLRALGAYSLYKCSNLKTVKIPENVTSVGDGSFLDCTGIEKFTVAAGNDTYCAKDGILYSKDMTELVCFPRGRKDTSFSVPVGVTKIGGEALSRTQIKTLKLPSTLREIGDYAFAELPIESIDLPAKLTTIGGDVFCKCDALKEIKLPDSVTEIGAEAFNECAALEKVTLPASLTTLGQFAFSGCVRLTEITLPALLEDLGDAAFMGCTSLKTIAVNKKNGWFTVENGVLYNKNKTTLVCYPSGLAGTTFAVPDTVATIAPYAFAVNHTLTAVTLSDSLTELGDRAFEYVTEIKTITLPKSVATLGAGVFAFCSSLEKIDVAAGNTAFKWENDTLLSADGYKLYFYSPANKAEEVVVPLTVAQLMDCAFAGNPYLKRVTLLNASSSISGDVFDGCRDDFVLSGYDQSTAHSYAFTNGLNFALTDEPLPTGTTAQATAATATTAPQSKDTKQPTAIGDLLREPLLWIGAGVVLLALIVALVLVLVKKKK